MQALRSSTSMQSPPRSSCSGFLSKPKKLFDTSHLHCTLHGSSGPGVNGYIHAFLFLLGRDTQLLHLSPNCASRAINSFIVVIKGGWEGIFR